MGKPREFKILVGLYPVLGRRGMGKTYYIGEFIQKLLDDGREIVLVADRVGQYKGT